MHPCYRKKPLELLLASVAVWSLVFLRFRVDKQDSDLAADGMLLVHLADLAKNLEFLVAEHS